MPISANPAFVVLEDIHVAAPCSVPWDQMNGDHRIRHCADCHLNVYNISEMTRSEAEQLIRHHEGRLCVRFYRRADGTLLTRNCPRGLERLIRRVSRIAATVVATAMTVGSAFSQAASSNTQQMQENQGNTGIDITVLDPSGALIPNAQVYLCRCKDNTRFDVRTDAIGVAHVAGLSPGKYSLEIKARGFKSRRQNIKVQAQKTERVPVMLQVAPTSVTIEVTAPAVEIQGMVTMGAVSTPVSLPTTGPGGRPGSLR